MIKKVEIELGGRTLTFETGRIAKQADGAVLVSYSDSVVLVTAVSDKKTREGLDFFPLTVEYQEKAFAAGKIPGGFFRREGRPGVDEILTCRVIDRPIRPLFPAGYRNETQIIATVMSADRAGNPDVLSLCGTSTALTISDIPFDGPIAGLRVGRIDGRLIVNPTIDEQEDCDIDLLVAARRDAIVILISAGGFGVGQVEEVLASLLQLRRPAQIVAICGRNEELKARVDRLTGDVPSASGVTLKVVGYTTAMDEYMAAADFVVGKPGGLTMSEALAYGKVFVVVNPIPGQEERNADHLLEEGAAIRCNNLPILAYKIDRLLDDPQRLISMRENIRRLARPRAAHEIVAKLQLLEGTA
jgi:ribonuclease PH